MEAETKPKNPIRSLARMDFSLDAMDPAIARIVHPVLAAFSKYYYRANVEGAEHLTNKASLMVATHNGIWHLADMVPLITEFWNRFGPETPAHGLVHNAVLKAPGLGELIRRLGGLPASHEAGLAALRADRPVLVCPGGDKDALKPFILRHTIHFENRRGFIKLAIRTQVPIIPIVSVGAHETIIVLNDGREMAKFLGFEKLFGIKSVPLALSLPFGLSIAGVPSIPFPSKVVVRILPPIKFDEPPDAEDDPDVVERCYKQVHSKMQTELDDLASKRKRVFFG